MMPEPAQEGGRPLKRRLLMSLGIAPPLFLFSAFAFLVLSGTVDTPFWSPVDMEACRAGGGLAEVEDLRPGELLTYGVYLPSSNGGSSRIERVDVLGNLDRGEVTVAFAAFTRGFSMGSFRGEFDRDRLPLVDVAEARVVALPKLDPDSFDPESHVTEVGARVQQLLISFRGWNPGWYESPGVRVVFRQGWRKGTCVSKFGVAIRVLGSG